MDNLIRKKIVLSLLDSDPKDADVIANEIGESFEDIEEQLRTLVSENICEKVNQDQVEQYIVKKDVEVFAQLVKEYLSDKEEHKDQIEQFITSDYYFTRIDEELDDYVLRRFYLESAPQTDEVKLAIKRILLASPSALYFALYEDTTRFSRMISSSTDENSEWISEILNSHFITELLKCLIADMDIPTYCILYAKLGILIAIVQIQVKLATLHGMFIEVVGGGQYSLFKAVEDIQAGQLISSPPMAFSNDGIALMHLGEFQSAHEMFDKALNAVNDPINKIIILNNKGLAFLRSKQYQKAIECFDEGIEFDPKSEFPLLRKNKQIAEEYLARATDADNLSEPTRIRFVLDQPVPFEETRFYEFKEIKGGKPADSITNTADEYAVAFLNLEGGRIFWGIRDSDRNTVGVTLDERQRDNVRRKVSEKLWGIRPPISDEDWALEFHQVYELQGNSIEDLWVVELVISPQQEKQVFYTNSGKLFVKTPGGKQRLLGPQVTEFILDRLQDDAETE